MAWTCKVIVLLTGWLLVVPTQVAAQSDAPWAIDVAEPGPDLPPRGQSLFDYVRGESQSAVAFPFTALLSQIRARLQLPETAPTPYAAVLIPIGRSLQRHAAAPDYFRFPRVVVAVLGESTATAAPLLKDRLYLGYQEQAGVLEVISYNEAMGRFEFQVVKDYRPGVMPRVYYAKRAICTACHQNQAPIFARPLWRETNANPMVAARLLAERRDFYGIPVQRGIDIPNAIDDATQRANRYALTQLLWTTGCAATTTPVQCRATLFEAALQLRLSGGRAYAADNPALATLRAAWQLRWPMGLRIADPEIPNRDPLAEGDAATTTREVKVPAAVDPLLMRPPVAVARFATGADQDALVAGLAEFFSTADMQQLDAALQRLRAPAQTRRYSAACRFTRTAAEARHWRLDVQCAEPALAVEGRLYFVGQRLQRGTFDRLQVRDDTLDDVDVTAGAAVRSAGVDLALRRGAWHARRRDGNALTVLQLRWSAAAARAASFTGRLVLEEQEDYAPVHAALQALTKRTGASESDLFDDAPVQRARLMPALLTQLGSAMASPCCVEAAGLAPPRMEPSTALDLTRPSGLSPRAASALRHLQRYCAPCHDSAERFPPNFLSGDLATVQAKLTHCAARIDYRLSMWALAPAQRRKTPMPPEPALRADQIDPLQWPADPMLHEIQAYVRSLRGSQPAVAADYSQLPTCLSDGG